MPPKGVSVAGFQVLPARCRANLAADRYTLTSELGRRGLVVVRRARDSRQGRGVAVKVMVPQVAVSVANLLFVRPLFEGETLRGNPQFEARVRRIGVTT